MQGFFLKNCKKRCKRCCGIRVAYLLFFSKRSEWVAFFRKDVEHVGQQSEKVDAVSQQLEKSHKEGPFSAERMDG